MCRTCRKKEIIRQKVSANARGVEMTKIKPPPGYDDVIKYTQPYGSPSLIAYDNPVAKADFPASNDGDPTEKKKLQEFDAANFANMIPHARKHSTKRKKYGDEAIGLRDGEWEKYHHESKLNSYGSGVHYTSGKNSPRDQNDHHHRGSHHHHHHNGKQHGSHHRVHHHSDHNSDHNENGDHHHRSHHGTHHLKHQYHSQKPNTDTIAELSETDDVDERQNAKSNEINTITEKISMETITIERARQTPHNNKKSTTEYTKLRIGDTVNDDVSIQIEKDSKTSDIKTSNDLPSVPDDAEYLPPLPIDSNSSDLKLPLHSDIPVIDGKERTLSERDVEDILQAPRLRLYSDESVQSTSPLTAPSYPIQSEHRNTDDILVDIKNPWTDDTTPIIDHRVDNGGETFEGNNYVCKSKF